MSPKKNENATQENNTMEEIIMNEDLNQPGNPENTNNNHLEENTDNTDLNDLLEEMDVDPEDDVLQEMEAADDFSAELLADLDGDTDSTPDIASPPALDSSAASDIDSAADIETQPKSKRSVRRKKNESANSPAETSEDKPDTLENPESTDTLPSSDKVSSADHAGEAQGSEMPPVTATPVAPSGQAPARKKPYTPPVLTIINRDDVQTEISKEDAIWHEIHNAYRTRKIMTGQLGGIEQMDNGKTIAIVDYKGFRIIIPLKEMMINLGRSPSGQEYTELMQRQNKILGNMLGAEIDFIVRGIDSKTRSVVASRKEAMLKKRQIFYLDTDAAGMYRIYEGRIVQARVIAVAEKVIRVEVFGVECSIMARDLAWDWIGDAHERFSVGDQVLVHVLNVRRDSLEDLSIKADIKSVSQNTNLDNLKKCRIQSKYAGKVTDVYKGVVYIRLANGVNAVAHSCFDYRTPGKKDDVSFAVTKLDEERGVAVGIITRIIRQNL